MKNLKKEFLTTFVIGAALLSGIVILLNMIFNNINLGRFDLTSDQAYKLSPSVEKILSDLQAPIELTYYVSSSEKMPTQWKNLERDVIEVDWLVANVLNLDIFGFGLFACFRLVRCCRCWALVEFSTTAFATST